MKPAMSHNAYGKSNVRLVKVTREGDTHRLTELSANVTLQGDLDATFLKGDNRLVVPTDTVKNTVYVVARQLEFSSAEVFALHLSKHFLDKYEHLTKADVELTETPWNRVTVDGKAHSHAFEGGSAERRVARVIRSREGLELSGGVEALPILKTTGSAFRNFHRDELTTLPDADDRLFGTVLTAHWTYAEPSPETDYNSLYSELRTKLLEVFAKHDESLAVQQTLHLMGTKALEHSEAIKAIYLSMPNVHRLLVDLSPFGLNNPNEIFVPTDEPAGMIEAVLERA